MSDEKTTTERLRALLDDRGVKWWLMHDVESGYYEDRDTEFLVNGCKHVAHEWGRGLQVDMLTPEQAVEATLGRGTCRKVRAWEDDPRGGGGWVLVCSECDEFLANDGEDGEFDGPNFCPNCGRKVVK